MRAVSRYLAHDLDSNPMLLSSIVNHYDFLRICPLRQYGQALLAVGNNPTQHPLGRVGGIGSEARQVRHLVNGIRSLADMVVRSGIVEEHQRALVLRGCELGRTGRADQPSSHDGIQ
jgi:hypothetical protein